MHRHALLMIALALCPPAAQEAPLYRCAMIDGSEHLGPQNLVAQFPAAVRGCEKLYDDTAQPLTVDDGHGLTVVVQDSPPEPASAFAPVILAASRRNGVDPRLVNALIAVESAHQPSARSPKGALGLMQITPATGARYGARSADDLLNPSINIEIGTRHLGELHRTYPGRLDLVLAAYNAGEGAVARHGNRVPPYPETIGYVRKILALYGDGASIRME